MLSSIHKEAVRKVVLPTEFVKGLQVSGKQRGSLEVPGLRTELELVSYFQCSGKFPLAEDFQFVESLSKSSYTVEISDLKMWFVNLAVSFPSTCIVCTPHRLPHLPPLGLACTLTCERHALGHQHPQQDILQHLRPRGRCPFWILLFKSFVHTNRTACCGFEYAQMHLQAAQKSVLWAAQGKLPSTATAALVLRMNVGLQPWRSAPARTNVQS